MNQYLKTVRQKFRYKEFVQVLNGILQLTNRETAVLARLMEIDDDWPTELLDIKNIVSAECRKRIIKEERINKSNLTNYIKLFKSKGIILTDEEGRGYINPTFKPADLNGKYKILFILDFEKEEQND